MNITIIIILLCRFGGKVEQDWERTLSIIELDLILFSLQFCWNFSWNFVNRMIVLDEWWWRENWCIGMFYLNLLVDFWRVISNLQHQQWSWTFLTNFDFHLPTLTSSLLVSPSFFRTSTFQLVEGVGVPGQDPSYWNIWMLRTSHGQLKFVIKLQLITYWGFQWIIYCNNSPLNLFISKTVRVVCTGINLQALIISLGGLRENPGSESCAKQIIVLAVGYHVYVGIYL